MKKIICCILLLAVASLLGCASSIDKNIQGAVASSATAHKTSANPKTGSLGAFLNKQNTKTKAQ